MHDLVIVLFLVAVNIYTLCRLAVLKNKLKKVSNEKNNS